MQLHHLFEFADPGSISLLITRSVTSYMTTSRILSSIGILRSQSPFLNSTFVYPFCVALRNAASKTFLLVGVILG